MRRYDPNIRYIPGVSMRSNIIKGYSHIFDICNMDSLLFDGRERTGMLVTQSIGVEVVLGEISAGSLILLSEEEIIV